MYTLLEPEIILASKARIRVGSKIKVGEIVALQVRKINEPSLYLLD